MIEHKVERPRYFGSSEQKLTLTERPKNVGGVWGLREQAYAVEVGKDEKGKPKYEERRRIVVLGMFTSAERSNFRPVTTA